MTVTHKAHIFYAAAIVGRPRVKLRGRYQRRKETKEGCSESEEDNFFRLGCVISVLPHGSQLIVIFHILSLR